MQTLLSVLQIPTSIFLAFAAVFFVWHTYKAEGKYNKAGDAISAFFLIVSLILVWR